VVEKFDENRMPSNDPEMLKLEWLGRFLRGGIHSFEGTDLG
jgi:hypothetical protein